MYGGHITGGWNRLEQGTFLFEKFSTYSNNMKNLDGYLGGITLNNYFWRFQLNQKYGYVNRELIKENKNYKGFYGNVKLTAYSILFNKIMICGHYCDKDFAIKRPDTGEYYEPTYMSDWLESENRELAIDEYGFSVMAEIETVNQFYFEIWFDKSYNLSGNPDINNWTWENGIREKTHYVFGVSYYYLSLASFEIYFDYMINRYSLDFGFYDGKYAEFVPKFTMNAINGLKLQFGITSIIIADNIYNTQLGKRYFIGLKYNYKKNILIKAEFVYKQPNTIPPWIEAPLWYEGPYWNYDTEYGGDSGLDNYFRVFFKISI